MHGHRAQRAFDGVRALRPARWCSSRAARSPASSGIGRAPTGCPVTDLGAATLLSGLIETHVHLCADSGPQALEQLADPDADRMDAIVTRSLEQHLAAGPAATL